MGILDWFKDRQGQFEPDPLSDELVVKAVDKAITLTNPRLKLVPDWEERLAPLVEDCVNALREQIAAIPAAVRISAANWASEPALRAFFAGGAELTAALGHSRNLRTFFDKYRDVDQAFIILGLTYNERHKQGMSLLGDQIRRDATQTVVDFSIPRVRICGHTEDEVRRLLGAQSFEYLVAQAMAEISDERSERQELEDSRNLIRARLRLLQQQGPGLGSVFDAAPETSEQRRLETMLLENERLLEQFGSSQTVLEHELDCLCQVLKNRERYIRFESQRIRLSTLNVVVDAENTDVASDVQFTMAVLAGIPKVQRAFVLGTLSRSELPQVKLDIANAERFL